MKNFTTLELEKAQQALQHRSIISVVENESLYINLDGVLLELSENEIKFQINEFDNREEEGIPTIEGIEFGEVTVVLPFNEELNEFDFGALTLKCEDREFILDVVKSYKYEHGGIPYIECELEVDLDTFPMGSNKEAGECPYNLKSTDFFRGDLEATLFIGDEAPDVELISFYIVSGGTLTKSIDVNQD